MRGSVQDIDDLGDHARMGVRDTMTTVLSMRDKDGHDAKTPMKGGTKREGVRRERASSRRGGMNINVSFMHLSVLRALTPPRQQCGNVPVGSGVPVSRSVLAPGIASDIPELKEGGTSDATVFQHVRAQVQAGGGGPASVEPNIAKAR